MLRAGLSRVAVASRRPILALPTVLGWLAGVVLLVGGPWSPGKAAPWALRVHPDGGLFVGDVLSFEVLAPPGYQPPPDGSPTVRLQVLAGDRPTWEAPLQVHGIEGYWAAVFPWVWATRGVAPGAYTVVAYLDAEEVLRQTITLAPAAARPWWETGVAWRTAAWPVAEVTFFSRTAAARDLPLVRSALEDARRGLAQPEGFPQTPQPVPLVLMPRLLGQGGFTSGHIWFTYTDRDATASYFPILARHELVHWLDRQREARYRSLMLVEGLAVYLAGGHYKPEPLAPRAAALLLLEEYIPLTTLADGYFYDYQHEIAYLEAGALVEYMVQRWGWPAFAGFYWGLDPDLADGAGPIFDANLQQHFGLSLARLDADFRRYLAAQPDAAAWADDVRLTVAIFEALRRYQRQMDPSAYYGTAWLPDLGRMQSAGAVADAVRGPATVAHATVELLLQEAHVALAAGDVARAQANVAAVQALLDAQAAGRTEPWRAHPEAARVAGWVQAARGCGVEPTDLQRRADGQVWVWGWPRGGHPGLAAVAVAPGGRAEALACRVDLHGGLVWPGGPTPVYVPGPRHVPRWMRAGR